MHEPDGRRPDLDRGGPRHACADPALVVLVRLRLAHQRVDPEEGGVRIALFAAMAAFLIAAICVPESFGDLGTQFAIAYGAVRIAHIALFLIASRDDPNLRRSVWGLGGGTAVAVSLLVAGSFLEPGPQAAVWAFALALDLLEPYVFGAEG